jgi:hypothetical protein
MIFYKMILSLAVKKDGGGLTVISVERGGDYPRVIKMTCPTNGTATITQTPCTSKFHSELFYIDFSF